MPPNLYLVLVGSWQQYKQGPAVQAVIPTVHQAAVQTAPRVIRPPGPPGPAAAYPFKRFVKSQVKSSITGGGEGKYLL